MAKCIFTGEETLTQTKGYPVSRNGREVLRERQQVMAEARLEEFKQMIAETNEKIIQKTNEQNEQLAKVEAGLNSGTDVKAEFAPQTPNLLTPTYDVKDFTPSVKEVLVEQVRQNKLESQEESADQPNKRF